MDKLNKSNKPLEMTSPPVVRKYEIDGKAYIVKSIFVGDRDLKNILLNLAEKKALREMGLDVPSL